MNLAITGGHLTPALSVIEALKDENFTGKIYFFGRKKALENDKAKSFESETIKKYSGLIFIPITSGRLNRYFTFSNIFTPFLLLFGFIQSIFYLIRYRIDLVVAFGGYVSVPTVIAGWLLGKKILIHEQTFILGLANRINSLFADKILLSWTDTRGDFDKKKIIITGKPTLKSIMFGRNPQYLSGFNKNKKPVLYISGGNQGSHAINEVCKSVIERLLTKYAVIHQTGAAQQFQDFEYFTGLKEKLSEEKKKDYYLIKNINPEELGAVYHNVDVCISRSGINTVCELAYHRIPSVLIPLPISADNEQKTNAVWLQKQGMANILEQKNLAPETLLSALAEIGNRVKIKGISIEVKNNLENAAGKIADLIINFYEDKNP